MPIFHLCPPWDSCECFCLSLYVHSGYSRIAIKLIYFEKAIFFSNHRGSHRNSICQSQSGQFFENFVAFLNYMNCTNFFLLFEQLFFLSVLKYVFEKKNADRIQAIFSLCSLYYVQHCILGIPLCHLKIHRINFHCLHSLQVFVQHIWHQKYYIHKHYPQCNVAKTFLHIMKNLIECLWFFFKVNNSIKDIIIFEKIIRENAGAQKFF